MEIAEDKLHLIIQKVMSELGTGKVSCDPMSVPEIPLEVSARHVHLSQDAVEELFGKGHKLTAKRDLSQPGEFLAEERVSIIGPKGIIENSAVLGPARPKSQVEISMADSRKLGVKAPVKDSGDVVGTPGIVLASSGGVAKLNEGVIIARRHIHMTPADATHWNLNDKEIVKVEVCSSRSLIFDDVLIRISDKFALAMHIDTDEAGACFADKDSRINILKAGEGSAYVPEKVSADNRQAAPDKELKVTCKLLTEGRIKGIVKSGVKKLSVSKKTIITSLAMDFLKDNKIVISRV
jgi:putative phosphotransacetylase